MNTEQITKIEKIETPWNEAVDDSVYKAEYNRMWSEWTEGSIPNCGMLGDSGKNFLIKVPLYISDQDGTRKEVRVVGGFKFIHQFSREIAEKDGIIIDRDVDAPMVVRLITCRKSMEDKRIRPLIGLGCVVCFSEQEFQGRPLNVLLFNTHKMLTASWKRGCKVLDFEAIGPENDPIGDGVIRRPMLFKNIQESGEFSRNLIQERLNAQFK